MSWLKSEISKMLDLYLSGAAVPRIAQVLNKEKQDVDYEIDRFFGDFDRIKYYEPFRRLSRIGKPITPNEREIINAHRKDKIDPSFTAKILSRRVDEFYRNDGEISRHREYRASAPGTDLVLAYRYAYYCHNISLVEDQTYDLLEKEEREFGGGYGILEKPGSDDPEDYPKHIRALGMYLMFKFAKKEDADAS